MATTKLPPRLTERAFRRYESAIADAVAVWPKALTVTPTGSAETFTCRFRDAVRSLRRNDWPTTINMIKFMDFVKNYQVSNRGDCVVIGPRNWSDLPTEPRESYSATYFPVETEAEFRVICALAGRRLLTQPLSVTGAATDWIIKAKADFDVEIETAGDGVTVF